jgi:hypothetical protein
MKLGPSYKTWHEPPVAPKKSLTSLTTFESISCKLLSYNVIIVSFLLDKFLKGFVPFGISFIAITPTPLIDDTPILQ